MTLNNVTEIREHTVHSYPDHTVRCTFMESRDTVSFFLPAKQYCRQALSLLLLFAVRMSYKLLQCKKSL